MDKTASIFDSLFIGDIKDGYTVRYDGVKSYYYRLKYNIDNDWINSDMVDRFVDLNATGFSQLSKDYVFNLMIFGHNDSSIFKKNLTKKDQPEIIQEYLEIKKEFIKDYKTISVFLAVTPTGEDLDTPPQLSKLQLTPLTALEIYNILFNIVNPPLFRDDLKAVPYNHSELADPSISIPMALTKTPVIEYDHVLLFDTTNCYQYYMPQPPNTLANEFSMNRAINELSGLDSNFFISVMFRNINMPSGLKSKKSMAQSSLVASLGSVNAQIVRAIGDFEKHLQEKNLSAVEMSMQIALFNEDINALKKDGRVIKTLNGFDGAVIVPNTVSRYDDYISMIPGTIGKYKYSFVVSSEQMATMLMFPQYDFNCHTIFEKKGRVLTSFDISNFKRTNKPGALIFAPPGSGKSALINYLYINLLIQYANMESLVIDFGASYRSLYSILNRDDMTYTDMNIDENNPVYYNPLDLDFGKEITKSQINTKIFILKSFLTVALELETNAEGKSKFDTLMDIVLDEMYTQTIFGNDKKRYPFLDENSRPEHTFYIDKYIESGNSDFEAFAKAMPLFSDISTYLYRSENVRKNVEENTVTEFGNKIAEFLANKSSYIFQGQSTQQLLNKHLIVDLKEILLKNQSQLNLLLIYLISSKLMQYMNCPEEEKSKPKFIFIDEYNQFKTRSAYIDVICDTIFKVGRKENIHLVLITQNMKDFSKGFFNTTGRMISFKPSSMDELDSLATITGEKIENLKPLMYNVGTVQGEYSELLVFNSDDEKTKNFYRLKLSKFEYYAFITTSADDRARRAQILKEENGDWKKTIYRMVDENARGLI